jgi:hypothetical protein
MYVSVCVCNWVSQKRKNNNRRIECTVVKTKSKSLIYGVRSLASILVICECDSFSVIYLFKLLL